MLISADILLKIVLAILAGGLIGIEREFRDKAAGFRTLIFICLGAALFTMFSSSLAGAGDPSRIAANVVSGVGFLGAGVILREHGRIAGLTTAAMIWLTAAIGMGIGGGLLPLTGVALLLVLVVLWGFPRLEGWIETLRSVRTYEIECTLEPQQYETLQAMFRDCGLQLHDPRQHKIEGNLVFTWLAIGKPLAHQRAAQLLVSDERIKAFHT
jgi:putative Mg2+ transporter-C (MgtC) family protein